MLTDADGAGTPSWVRFLVYVIAGTILIVLQVHEAPTGPGCALHPPPPRARAFFFLVLFIFKFFLIFFFLGQERWAMAILLVLNSVLYLIAVLSPAKADDDEEAPRPAGSFFFVYLF
jgi:hypothetical protein